MAHNARKRARVWAWIAIAAASACLSPSALSATADCAEAKKTYTTSCSMCHRADGKGYKAIKTVDFTDQTWQAAHKDSELISAISNGAKGTSMVSFKDQLSQQQIKDLVNCVIRSFGNKSAPEHVVPKGGSANSPRESGRGR